jgi:hypothetical protein
MLKKSLLTILATLSLAGAAFAGNWTVQHYGNTDYYNGSGGDSFTGQRYGNQYYWSGYDSNGNYRSGSSQRYGNTTYYNENDY